MIRCIGASLFHIFGGFLIRLILTMIDCALHRFQQLWTCGLGIIVRLIPKPLPQLERQLVPTINPGHLLILDDALALLRVVLLVARACTA